MSRKRMQKVKKLSPFKCMFGCCGRSQIYEDDEANCMLTPLGSIGSAESIELQTSSHRLQMSDFITEDKKSVQSCPEAQLQDVRDPQDVPAPTITETAALDDAQICPIPAVQEIPKVVAFGSSDADQNEDAVNKTYPKTPAKQSYQRTLEILESDVVMRFARILVSKAIRSALSYFLTTLAVRRALDSSKLMYELQERSSDEGVDCGSEDGEHEEETPMGNYVKALLYEILNTIEQNSSDGSNSDDEVVSTNEAGDHFGTSSEKEPLIEIQESAGPQEQASLQSGASSSVLPASEVSSERSDQTTESSVFSDSLTTLTPASTMLSSQSEFSVGETSCSSLDWDNYDFTTPLIRYDSYIIPTE